MPHMSNCYGVTEATKKLASKHVGNILKLLCAMHTLNGRELFQSGCHVSGGDLEDMKQCFKVQLGFEVWVNQSNKISNENLIPLLSEQLTLIKCSFPRKDGDKWCIPKMYSLSKM